MSHRTAGMDRCDSGSLHLRQEGTCFHRTRGRKLANVEGSDLDDWRLQGIARAQSDTLKTPTQGQEVD